MSTETYPELENPCTWCWEEEALTGTAVDQDALWELWRREPKDAVCASCWQAGLEENCYDQHYCTDPATCTRLTDRLLEDMFYLELGYI